MIVAAIDPTVGVIASAAISALLSIAGLAYGRHAERERITLKADASKVDIAFESLQGEVERCQGQCTALQKDNRDLRDFVARLMRLMQAAGIDVPAHELEETP